MLLRCASLLLVALAGTSARAAQAPESYHASLWSIANGLPQGSVNDLLQTRDGALWIATFGGLVRFDGLEFQVFDLDTLVGMPSNRVTALAPDAEDGLWLALQSGQVLHFRAGRVLEFLALPGKDPQPLALLHHPSGSLWVQANDGSVLRWESGAWRELASAGAGGSYEGLCLNADGSVCAALGEELAIFEASGEARPRFRAPARILSLATGDEQGPWIGLADGLARLRDGAIERMPLSLPDTLQVQAILAVGSDDLWLGTQFGLVHANPESPFPRGLIVESNAGLPPEIPVRAVLRDREGNIWFGSAGFGLVRLRPHELDSFGPLEWRTGVNALADDGEGGAWVGNACKGLAQLPDGLWEARPTGLPRSANPQGCIEALLQDELGRVWVGAGGEVVRRDVRASEDFLPVPACAKLSGRIGPIVRAAGGEVWVTALGEHDTRLLHLAPDDRVLEELALPEAILSLAVAEDGSLWAGADDALLHLVGGRSERFDAHCGLPRGALRDVRPDPAGGVWVASYGGGLGWLEGGKGATLTRAQGLPDNSISAIQDDGQGRLWLLTNLGLVMAQREELLRVARGSLARFDPVVLGVEAGMQEAEFGTPSSMRDSRGRLWFGTIAGPVRIDPRTFPLRRTPPVVRVERLRADDALLPLGERVEVPPLTRRLVFDYTAFALTAPERTHFRYRLDNFDEHWIEAGAQRWVAFTTLAPGDYTFHVEARNEGGIWSAAPARLQLVVLSAWWQTLLFRVASVLSLAALLMLLHRRRVATIRNRAQVLLDATQGRAQAEARESRLREELAHAGRVAIAGELATSLAHEVNQPLAAIVTNAQAGQRYLARDGFSRADLDEILGDIAQQGRRASEVIRRLREFLRKHESLRVHLDVNQVVRDTLPLLRREIEEHGVRTTLELEENLPGVLADAVQLQQVVVNLVKNSCEALTRHPQPRLIEIRTSSYDGRVRMDVCDNGPGLAPQVAARLFQPYVTTKADGMGLGLAICRSIVEAHGGRLAAEPRAQGGMCFQLDLPIDSATEPQR